MKTLQKTLISAIAAATLAPISAMADIEDRIERSFKFDSNGSISLDNINGDVTIKGCDCDEVTIVAVVEASDQKTRDRIHVEIDASDSRIDIDTRYEKQDRRWSFGNNYSSVTYNLTVPKNVKLRGIELVNGDLDIIGVRGEIEAELVNGSVESDSMSGDAHISTVNGEMTLTYLDTSDVDTINLESVNGSIDLRLPQDVSADIEAETVSGRISNEFGIHVEKGKWVGSSMRGTIGSGDIRVTLENVNGRIRVRQN